MLQNDEYGFIIGEKRLKELNGNIAQIDNTTQEILAVLTQDQNDKSTANKQELSHLEQLIELSKKQNRIINRIDNTNQNSTNPPQNHPISATSLQNGRRLTARMVYAAPQQSINTSDSNSADKPNQNTQEQDLVRIQTRLTDSTPKNPNQRQRDAQGRFVGDEKSSLGKVLDKLTTAINIINLDTKSLSPEIDALHEIKDIVSPAGRAFKMMGRGASWLFGRKRKNDKLPKAQKQQNEQDSLHQREERRLLRLILRHIGDSSWLSWLLPFLTSRLGLDVLDNDQSRDGRGRGRGFFGGIFGRGKKGGNTKAPKLDKSKTKFKLPAWLKLSKLSNLAKLPTWVKGGSILGLMLSATELLNWKQMNVHERGGAIGSIAGGLAGSWAGGLAGATMGATIGSVIPGIGTAIGGIIGGIVGTLGGGWLGSDLGRLVGEKFAPHGAALIETVSTHYNHISSKIGVLTATATTVMYASISQTYRYVSDLVSRMWSVVQDGLSGISDFVTTLTVFAKSGLQMSLELFAGVVSTAISALDGLYQQAKQFIASKMNELTNYLSDKLSNFGGYLSDKFSSVLGGVFAGITGTGVTGGSADYGGSYTINNDTVQMGKWSKKLKANQFDKLAPMIAKKAVENGIDPETLLAFANIESSFDPNAQNANYGGLFQINKKQHPSWRDPEYNTNVATKMMADNKRYYHQKFGANAKWSTGLAYLYHQQGMGGATALLKNPNMSAAAALRSTKEWKNKTEDWIWEHIVKINGGHKGMTAKEFADLWIKRGDVLEDAYRKQGKYNANTKTTQSAGVGVKTSNTTYTQAKTQNDTGVIDKAIQSTKSPVGIGVKASNFVSSQPLVAEGVNNSWVNYASTALSILGVQTDRAFFKPAPVMPKSAPVPSLSNIVANIAPLSKTNNNTTAPMFDLSQEIDDVHLARLLSGGYKSAQ